MLEHLVLRGCVGEGIITISVNVVVIVSNNSSCSASSNSLLLSG